MYSSITITTNIGQTNQEVMNIQKHMDNRSKRDSVDVEEL